ncbi:PKD-like domain-containing protein [Proteiniphilum sp. UBA5384]|uniref:PKD-like domain-containing protein n=1 Tax=Proteiniphilum sp. UBA5384 TaxID=1947279 RepID=UPI0025F70BC0|nr:PKD-like domain-containing protein [Proteiniphilum sp. UBA5384]
MEKLLYMISVIALLVMAGCSKDDTVKNSNPPAISFDHESLIYRVKVGKSITITPTIENETNSAIYLWKVDGKIVSEKRDFTYDAGDEPEMMYLMFEVATDYGSDSKEICLEVVSLLAPQITMGVPEGGHIIMIDDELKLVPEITYDENATYKWTVDGQEKASSKDYSFSSTKAGTYKLALTATNEDGSDKLEFNVKVCAPEDMPFTAKFEKTVYNISLGRTAFIRPYWIENVFDATYTWFVDGVEITDVPEFSNPRVAMAECAKCTFPYTPATQGEHKVELKVKNKYITLSYNFIVNACPPEGTYKRVTTGAEDCNKVYEFTAAPGQFVNEGYTVYTDAEACLYATNRMNGRGYVSLGNWGGYIVVGFDHSIANDGDYNLQILGNAFRGSSEPGIVWVMQDENGDGLPNDTWYELKGSDYDTSVQDYAVTYYRPDNTHRPVAWTDNLGQSGQVDYLGFHTQDYYYPLWVKPDSYTIVGSRLKHKTVETSPGYWANGEFEWGYVDNFSPIDRLTNDENTNANVMGNHMKISHAVRHDGKPANLQYIDFVKVHTGLNIKAGWLGENSTEVFGVQDFNIIKKQ